jgi:hypothetical protein
MNLRRPPACAHAPKRQRGAGAAATAAGAALPPGTRRPQQSGAPDFWWGTRRSGGARGPALPKSALGTAANQVLSLCIRYALYAVAGATHPPTKQSHDKKTLARTRTPRARSSGENGGVTWLCIRAGPTIRPSTRRRRLRKIHRCDAIIAANPSGSFCIATSACAFVRPIA